MPGVDSYNYLGLDEATVRDPYPFYRLLQDDAPVYQEPEYGIFLISRYRDVLDVVRRPDVFSSAMPTGPGMPNLDKLPGDLRNEVRAAIAEGRLAPTMKGSAITERAITLLAADPPNHTRYRSLVNKVLNVRTARRWESRMRVIANDLVDDFIDHGEMEFVREFAHLLPLRVVGELLGAPQDDARLSMMFGGLNAGEILGNPNLALARMMDAARHGKQEPTAVRVDEFSRYFAERIGELRQRPIPEDFLSDLIAIRDEDGQQLNDQEVLSIIGHFRIAGHETSTKMITAAMYYLVANPIAMAAVRADPSLCENLVEEALRIEAPVQGLFRTATRDAVVGDVTIPKGSMLMAMYGAANRDTAQFANPDVFEPARQNARTHVAFGQGPHHCAGAPLARSEGRIAFEVLLGRLDEIRFANGNEFERTASFILRGLKQLRLTFTAVR